MGRDRQPLTQRPVGQQRMQRLRELRHIPRRRRQPALPVIQQFRHRPHTAANDGPRPRHRLQRAERKTLEPRTAHHRHPRPAQRLLHFLQRLRPGKMNPPSHFRIRHPSIHQLRKRELRRPLIGPDQNQFGLRMLYCDSGKCLHQRVLPFEPLQSSCTDDSLDVPDRRQRGGQHRHIHEIRHRRRHRRQPPPVEHKRRHRTAGCRQHMRIIATPPLQIRQQPIQRRPLGAVDSKKQIPRPMQPNHHRPVAHPPGVQPVRRMLRSFNHIQRCRGMNPRKRRPARQIPLQPMPHDPMKPLQIFRDHLPPQIPQPRNARRIPVRLDPVQRHVHLRPFLRHIRRPRQHHHLMPRLPQCTGQPVHISPHAAKAALRGIFVGD